MTRKKLILISFALVLAMFTFDRYFLSPKTEMLTDTLESRYNALKREEQMIQAGAGMSETDVKALLEEMKNAEDRVMREKSEFLASVKLQSEVMDIGSKAGITISTIRPLSAVKAGNFRSVPLYLEGNGDIKQLSDFLKGIEASKLLIKLDKLNVNITNMQNLKDLKLRIQVSGLAKI